MSYQPILEQLYPDGSVQGECGVFVHKLMSIPLVGNTIQTKTTAVQKYGYTAEQVQGGYDAGDAIIFNIGTAAGHIAFCNNIENGIMTLTESNWHLDFKVHHTRQISAKDPTIVGCLRGKLLFPIPPMPPTPRTFNQRVLVLCSNIPDANMSQLKAGITQYTDAVLQKTTDFHISVDYAPTDTQFTIVTQTSDDTIYIQPGDVAFAGAQVQQATGKQYDVVCLVYDDSKMTPMPNHPIEAPIYEHGFNIIEIPLDWVSSLNTPNTPLVIYSDAVEIFFSHEMSHADYFLTHAKGGFDLHDKTHDPQLLGYPSPVDYFIQYLIELRPFWGYFCLET